MGRGAPLLPLWGGRYRGPSDGSSTLHPVLRMGVVGLSSTHTDRAKCTVALCVELRPVTPVWRPRYRVELS